MAKLVFARRIFPALGNANEYPLLSSNGKIAMPKTAYQISLKGHVGSYDFDRLADSLGGSLATGQYILAY